MIFRLQLYAEPPMPDSLAPALGAFGSAQGGLPPPCSSVFALEELEVRGARGEPKRLPLLPAPPLSARVVFAAEGSLVA